jgi:hypothetical protein
MQDKSIQHGLSCPVTSVAGTAAMFEKPAPMELAVHWHRAKVEHDETVQSALQVGRQSFESSDS